MLLRMRVYSEEASSPLLSREQSTAIERRVNCYAKSSGLPSFKTRFRPLKTVFVFYFKRKDFATILYSNRLQKTKPQKSDRGEERAEISDSQALGEAMCQNDTEMSCPVNGPGAVSWRSRYTRLTTHSSPN